MDRSGSDCGQSLSEVAALYQCEYFFEGGMNEWTEGESGVWFGVL